MNKRKILLFGGTTEAKSISEVLLGKGIDFTLSVATSFGKEKALCVPNVFSDRLNKNVFSKRLNKEEIEKLLPEYGLVIDATHPYAVLASENIKQACAATNTKYIRVLRPPTPVANTKSVLYFPGNYEAVQYLNTQAGNILLTTGSKCAADFTGIKDFAQRVFIRMLPLAEVLQKCLDLGFKNSHLICVHGVFSKEFNVEMIKMFDVKYLVTKDSGETGGFDNKLAAARETGTELIVISRPSGEEGLTLSQMLVLLRDNRNGDVLN